MTQNETIRNDLNDDLQPMDIGLGDSHIFKTEVLHPVRKEPFTPCIFTIVDAATRLVVGWSVGDGSRGNLLHEALKHAATVHEEKPWGGIFAILIIDAGYVSRATASVDKATDIFERIGTTLKSPSPFARHNNRILEKTNRSLWKKAAKTLANSINKKRRVNSCISGEQGLLLSWQEFMDFCYDAVDEFNRSLWSTWKSHVEQGWDPHACQLTEKEVEILFQPREVREVKKSGVTLFGNTYSCEALADYTGAKVQVGYDIHDETRVQIWNDEERLVCYATLEKRKVIYFADSEMEKAGINRTDTRNHIKFTALMDVEVELAERETVIPLPENRHIFQKAI